MWRHGMCRQNAASPRNVAVRGECGVTECVVRMRRHRGMWRQGGMRHQRMCRHNAASPAKWRQGGARRQGMQRQNAGECGVAMCRQRQGQKCYTMCGHPEYIAAAVTYYTHFRQRGFNTLCEYVCRGCFAVLVGKDIEAQHCTALLTSGADKMSRESFEASKSG